MIFDGMGDVLSAAPQTMPYMEYPGRWQCVVTAVRVDQDGFIIVDVETLRQGSPVKNCFSQTSSPQVGDPGFVDFLDGRRERPFYVGITPGFRPFQAIVSYVGINTLNVDLENGQQLLGVPYVVTGQVPQVGDTGLLFAVGGIASQPVYIGPMSLGY